MASLLLQGSLSGRPVLVVVAIMAASFGTMLALVGFVMGVRRFGRHRSPGHTVAALLGVFSSVIAGLIGAGALVATLIDL